MFFIYGFGSQPLKFKQFSLTNIKLDTCGTISFVRKGVMTSFINLKPLSQSAELQGISIV